MNDEPIRRALTALRDAPDRRAPELMRAWRTVKELLVAYSQRRAGGVAADRDEAVTEALIDIVRGIDGARLEHEASARSWVRRVYERALADLLRSKQRRKEIFDERPADKHDYELADRKHADDQASADARRHPERLDEMKRRLFDRVDEHIDAHVRRHARVNARRRAELAYARIVRERDFDALERMAGGEVRRDTLYKWVERGRDQGLFPVARRWASEIDRDSEEGGFVQELLELLEAHARADDAGGPGDTEEPS